MASSRTVSPLPVQAPAPIPAPVRPPRIGDVRGYGAPAGHRAYTGVPSSGLPATGTAVPSSGLPSSGLPAPGRGRGGAAWHFEGMCSGGERSDDSDGGSVGNMGGWGGGGSVSDSVSVGSGGDEEQGEEQEKAGVLVGGAGGAPSFDGARPDLMPPPSVDTEKEALLVYVSQLVLDHRCLEVSGKRMEGHARALEVSRADQAREIDTLRVDIRDLA